MAVTLAVPEVSYLSVTHILPGMSDPKTTGGDANLNSITAARLVENLNQALANLRHSIGMMEEVSQRSVKLLEEGADLTTALVAAFPSETRSVMNDALKQLEEARHEIRLYVFAVSLDQGVSISELGRQYGFSRQLAARYAKDAREAQERWRL
jgi:hypothetical protein